METGCLYGRLLKLAGCGCSPIGCGLWRGLALVRGVPAAAGGSSSARADSVRCPVPIRSRICGLATLAHRIVGRCLGLPAPYATRIEAPAGERLPLCSGLCRQDGAENVPFSGSVGSCLGLWWLLPGALARAEAQRVQFVFVRCGGLYPRLGYGPILFCGNSPGPVPSRTFTGGTRTGFGHARGGPACLCALMARSPESSLFCLDVLCGTAPEPLAWHGARRVGELLGLRFAPYPLLLCGSLLDTG